MNPRSATRFDNRFAPSLGVDLSIVESPVGDITKPVALRRTTIARRDSDGERSGVVASAVVTIRVRTSATVGGWC